MKKISYLLVLFLLSTALSHLHSANGHKHTCVHDQVQKNIDVKVMPQMSHLEKQALEKEVHGAVDMKHHQGSTTPFWHNIRIFVSFEYADSQLRNAVSLKSTFEIVKRQVRTSARYFQQFYRVYNTQLLHFLGGTCNEISVPKFAQPIDLFIGVKVMNDEEDGTVASAGACYLSSVDKRPIIGHYTSNLAHVKQGPLGEYLDFDTSLHEIMHILGFSGGLYQHFRVPGTNRARQDVTGQMTIGNQRFTAITMSEVVDYGRKFFGCSALGGIPLENNGGAGSVGAHWEKLFLPHEVMNPSTELPSAVSEFTATLFRATGWYQVDENSVQRYDWGQNSGCNHFKICPEGGSGYCASQDIGSATCSAEWNAKAVCNKDTASMSGCPYKAPLENSCMVSEGKHVNEGESTEFFGPGSRCVNTKSRKFTRQGTRIPWSSPRCQRVECNGETITIHIQQRRVICGPQETGRLKDFGHGDQQIECPNPRDFCPEFNSRCPNDCNGRGLCLVNKTCFCREPWAGWDCSSMASRNAHAESVIAQHAEAIPEHLQALPKSKLASIAYSGMVILGIVISSLN